MLTSIVKIYKDNVIYDKPHIHSYGKLDGENLSPTASLKFSSRTKIALFLFMSLYCGHPENRSINKIYGKLLKKRKKCL